MVGAVLAPTTAQQISKHGSNSHTNTRIKFPVIYRIIDLE